jgi:putative flippase GtrA
MNRSILNLWNRFGKQGVKFCIVGGFGVVFGSALLYALTEYLHIWYIYSNWIAAVIGQVFAFLGYKYWAFVLSTSRQAYSFSTQFVIHWIVWGMGLLIATGILYSLTTYCHIWYIFSSWVATVVSSTSNFLSHKFFTYKPVAKEDLVQATEIVEVM